jgi:hypothetical protein
VPSFKASSHSLKVERKEARKEEEEAKERSIKSIWIPIHLLKRNNQRLGQWQSKMFRIGQPRGNRNVMASLPPPAGFYTENAKLVQKFVL